MTYTSSNTGTEEKATWFVFVKFDRSDHFSIASKVASKVDPYLDFKSTDHMFDDEIPNDSLIASMNAAKKYERRKNRKVYDSVDEFMESLS